MLDANVLSFLLCEVIECLFIFILFLRCFVFDVFMPIINVLFLLGFLPWTVFLANRCCDVFMDEGSR